MYVHNYLSRRNNVAQDFLDKQIAASVTALYNRIDVSISLTNISSNN